jgi:hypothetical protein
LRQPAVGAGGSRLDVRRCIFEAVRTNHGEPTDVEMTEQLANDHADAGRRTLVADRVYGGIAAVAILLALFFLVFGGAEDGASPAPKAVPTLRLIAPAAGGETAQPITLRFDAGAALAPDGSDPAAKRHLHARIGRSEVMPGASDVRRLEGTRHEWTLPRLPAGTHALSLYWSDEFHRPLPDGASDSVVVQVR